MEQLYNKIIQEQGYNQLVCDIFPKWEDVKDEILIPERKTGSGNGTIHIFLGAADSELRKEFASYYYAVEHGEDPSIGAIRVRHHFLTSNIISMLGYVCQYYYSLGKNVNEHVQGVLSQLAIFANRSKILTTNSFFKLSTGASKLRPYFKQFDSDGVFVKLIRQLLLPNSGYKISLYKNNNNEYAAFWLIGFNWLSDYEADSNKEYLVPEKLLFDDTTLPLQQIIYGAPGTGKSHEIKESTATAEKEGRVIRTTFHPDSDYSTFVGAYKPTSVEVPVMTMIGTKAVPAENPDGTQRKEKKIVYEFVPQAFLKAYTGAWKNQDQPFFLIIEEINRGNCAQIFGDLFQLLDRNDEGMSEYPISPDEDIQKFLLTDKKYGFANLTEEQKTVIPNEVRNGELLILPKNLHIWATMNTSDQSLFPIDSAFKRRWDWKYIPIVNGEKGWMIEVNGKRYNWWTFLDIINEKIYHFTHSEDKKMGYFFCKPKGNIIDIETFVGKVIFYIWNDVFKDIVEEAGELFDDADKSRLTFNKFYTLGNDGKAKVVANKVELFLQNVGVEPEKVDNNPVLDEDGNDVTGTGNRNYDYTKYSINGQGSYPKGRVAQEAISLFISLHPEMSDIDVVNTWVGLNVKIPNIVETSQMFASRTSSSFDPGLNNRFKTIQMPNGNILYVSNQYNVERINDLIEKVNAQSWGIHIERI